VGRGGDHHQPSGRADLDATYETNGLVRSISGSPASIIFTIQSD
jgi:hypothetical protein